MNSSNQFSADQNYRVWIGQHAEIVVGLREALAYVGREMSWWPNAACKIEIWQGEPLTREHASQAKFAI